MKAFSLSHPAAVVFDCDGTLVDSEAAHISSWERTLHNYGLSLCEEDRIILIGQSDDLIAAVMAQKIGSMQKGIKTNRDLERTLRSQKMHYLNESLVYGLPEIAGTVSLVRRLASQKDRLGFKLAIASAATRNEILWNVKNLRLNDVFDVIVSGNDDLSSYIDPEGVNKPKPYVYLHAAKLLGIAPEFCVAIEDSHTGVTAAVRAGYITIAVPNASTKKHDLSQADLIVDTFSNTKVDAFWQLIEQVAHNKKRPQ